MLIRNVESMVFAKILVMDMRFMVVALCCLISSDVYLCGEVVQYDAVYTVSAVTLKAVNGNTSSLEKLGITGKEESGDRLEGVLRLLKLCGVNGQVNVGVPFSDVLSKMPVSGILVVELLPVAQNALYDFRALKKLENNAFVLLGGVHLRKTEGDASSIASWLNERSSGRILRIGDEVSQEAQEQATHESTMAPVLSKDNSLVDRDAATGGPVSLEGSGVSIPSVIDLGTILKTENELVFSFRVANRSGKSIRLYGFKGECSCFKGVVGPEFITPYSTEVYRGKIDLSRVKSNEFLLTGLAFKSDDPDLSQGSITIKGTFDSDRQLFLEPSKIEFGRVRSGYSTEILIRVFSSPDLQGELRTGRFAGALAAEEALVKHVELIDMEPRKWGKYVSHFGFRVMFDFTYAKRGLSYGTLQFEPGQKDLPKISFKYSFTRDESNGRTATSD